jgi:hypothetical protein
MAGSPPPEYLNLTHVGALNILGALYWGGRLSLMLPDLDLASRIAGTQTDAPVPPARATFFKGVLLSEDVRLVPKACCSRDLE